MDEIILIENIKNKIYTLRGMQVMIDSDLAKLYNVETKILNQAVKRNKGRFPEDFCFQLNKSEFENWKSQIVTSNYSKMGLRKLPYCFTEAGVANLSSVLRSKNAIEINIQIIRAFVSMRRYLQSNNLFLTRLDNIEKKQLVYDTKLDEVFNLLENNMLEEKEGIFYDGQVFDAYVFVCSLVKKAKIQIILIDNYLDESILEIFTKTNVKVIIYSQNYLKLDLEKVNEQYGNIEIKKSENIYDRFLIVDRKEVYQQH